MNYLFLVYSNGQVESLPAKERELFDEACRFSSELLRESGYLLATVDLRRDTAVTLHRQHETLLLSDDPPTTAEKLVGVCFMNARDLNEVIQLASKMPQLKYGPISIWASSA